MVLKDRKRIPTFRSKRGPRNYNPNEIKIPENLKPDEKDKLLQELKKKWQADFSQRIRYEEANRMLREQVNQLNTRLNQTTNTPSSFSSTQKPTPTMTSTSATTLLLPTRGSTTKKPLPSSSSSRPSGVRSMQAGTTVEDRVLRETNMIIVLTKRNKELMKERKKMEEFMHLKVVQLENEAKKATKFEKDIDLLRQKHTRERAKLDAQLTELLRTKTKVEEKVHELERKNEAMARIQLSLEHQINGFRNKLDSLLIDYSDITGGPL
ncbi:hypothetical protein HMI55_006614 [Coelomomyces lativittatus]|nr:hypothetical protein HMI55_006614 [Coelomomyces lativittatus]